jgi:hypothetical protein
MSNRFAFLATSTQLNSDASALKFAQWASRNCIGEDLASPIVSFAYQIDHLLEDCRDQGAALDLVRTQLPSLLPECKDIVQALAQGIPAHDEGK